MEGLEVPFQAIQDGLISIGNVLSYINPFDENFIFKDFFTNIGKILSFLNPFSENFILKGLLNILNPFSEDFFLTKLFNWINPFSDDFIGKKIIELLGDLLKFLFVPVSNPFENLSSKFNEKFAFVNQIKDLFSGLLGFNNYGDTVPSFNITWGGVTFALIDFSIFLDYRLWLHGIILAIAWFIFIRKTFNKLPAIIGGFSQ